MPATPTPKHGLHRPSGGDDADIPADLDQLTDQLDDLLAPYDAGVFASRPDAAVAGRRYFATDLSVEFVDTGSTWLIRGTPLIKDTIANRPPASVHGRGRLFLSTDEGPNNQGILYLDAGGAWAHLFGPTTKVVVGEGGGPSAGSGWQRSGSPGTGAQFWKEGTRVHLGGVMQRNAGSGTYIIFYLPAGYRPPRYMVYPRRYFNSTSWVTEDLSIGTDGSVSFTVASSVNTISGISLDGISFDLGNG